jgi:Ran GTPase-activating protein (RanGAP) involved in mRNA processing and transport
VQEIHLDYVTFVDIDIFWIAQALKVNSSLKRITLSSNKIGCHGMLFIFEALKESANSSLEFIYFCSNFIEDQAAYWIAEMLKVNSSLRMLNLNSNYITRKGVEAIAEGEALVENISIQSIRCVPPRDIFRDNSAMQDAVRKCSDRRRSNFRMLLCRLLHSQRNEMRNRLLDIRDFEIIHFSLFSDRFRNINKYFLIQISFHLLI